MDAAAPSAPPPAERSGPPRLGRRTYVVDRRFQYKYTATLAVFGALISLVFGAMMYLAHRDALMQALEGGDPQQITSQQNVTLFILMAGITVLMATALALFGLLVTHRVAGPVYVMSHYVGILARGRYPMMRPLRKSDELREFFQGFQGAIEAMRAREADEADVLQHALERLSTRSDAAELQEVVTALRAMHDRKRDATDRVDVGASSRKTAA